MPPPPAELLGYTGAGAGTIALLATFWRRLHISELLKGLREFLEDWRGEPARPGRDEIKPFPVRMTALERRAADLDHRVRGEVSSRLTLIQETVDESRAQGASNHEALIRLDSRVTDHRRRNEEQIKLLQEAIARNERHWEEVRLRGQQRRAKDPPDPAIPKEPP